ncbi:hypothetical protein BDK51DRAFT_29592 [Blyttiomyces helicus]|uniref:Uncharacterized protein n=1 Tax=Blyttiomyces helicus TaxID=388810 RepID=A0A4P9WN76_9FUNG|nr:hypothetical protein BDK51DRAFT_29592 [Blyttiomyces helicus]|eukprot:RKO93513.1 hypothetical protein BDK51DRAFT_29592 [Blyttiomyces helicus]
MSRLPSRMQIKINIENEGETQDLVGRPKKRKAEVMSEVVNLKTPANSTPVVVSPTTISNPSVPAAPMTGFEPGAAGEVSLSTSTYVTGSHSERVSNTVFPTKSSTLSTESPHLRCADIVLNPVAYQTLCARKGPLIGDSDSILKKSPIPSLPFSAAGDPNLSLT